MEIKVLLEHATSCSRHLTVRPERMILPSNERFGIAECWQMRLPDGNENFQDLLHEGHICVQLHIGVMDVGEFREPGV